jgi:hypothetical protein
MMNKAVSPRPSIGDDGSHSLDSEISALVNAGGSSATTEAEKKEIARQKRQAKKQIEPVVNVRVPIELLTQLDMLRGRRVGKISRNTWILEAIEDKIERETEANE